MIGNSLTGMEVWNLLFDDTNINNTGIVKCTKKKGVQRLCTDLCTMCT